jgi:hypothetical protein
MQQVIACSTGDSKVLRSALESMLPSFSYYGKYTRCIMVDRPGHHPMEVTVRKAWNVLATSNESSLNFGHEMKARFWRGSGQWYFDFYCTIPCSAPVLKMLIQRLEALDVPELPDTSRDALRQFLHAAAHLLD